MTGRPGRDELLAAAGRTVPDVVGPDLQVLFCGINPGLYTAWAGHHFARPGNRFWPAMHRSGFTPRQLVPAEETLLLDLGLGITNVVPRATIAAAELSVAELRSGAARLTRMVRKHSPAYLAVLGVTAYRAAFDDKRALLGRQHRVIGTTRIWLLPNPSGLNAHYPPARLASLFAELRSAVLGSGDA